jgi:hypothetical protein
MYRICSEFTLHHELLTAPAVDRPHPWVYSENILRSRPRLDPALLDSNLISSRHFATLVPTQTWPHAWEGGNSWWITAKASAVDCLPLLWSHCSHPHIANVLGHIDNLRTTPKDPHRLRDHIALLSRSSKFLWKLQPDRHERTRHFVLARLGVLNYLYWKTHWR